MKTRKEIGGPRDCWRTRNASAPCDVCGARPEVVHVPMHGSGFRCSAHFENCGPVASKLEASIGLAGDP